MISRLPAPASIGRLLALLGVCASLAACAEGGLGTPDNPNEPIPPARPSPFGNDGAGSSSPDYSSSQPLRF
ncbi:MAG TPA: hypothetical protein VIM61_09695 [Chthoniobacterales bacterium]|jgi:hypothetical protein